MKVAFHTLGCKVNSYETQAIKEQFSGLSFDIVDFSEEADVYVVNTCSVTQMAEHKSRQMLHRAKKLNPQAVIIATGCYVQRDAEEILKDPAIDIVVGNNRKSEIAEIAVDFLSDKLNECMAVDDLMRCRSYESQQISSAGSEGRIRAYVKIQDGCNRFCSYCIIPYLRGRSRSRDEGEILEEVKRLVDGGYKEIVITGIDISDYEDLIGLIEKIEKIPGDFRIRLGSLEEGIVSEELVKRLSACKKVCPHFHLSLQSGSDTVLKRMNRKYNSAQFLESVELIRKYYKNPGITTDIIVGFPGESDAEFQETLEFAKKAGFTQAHIFKYSRRAGTVADRMPDQISEAVKNDRSKILISECSKLHNEFLNKLVSTEQNVLVEEQIKDSEGNEIQIGFNPEYVKIAVKSEKNLVNEFVKTVPEKLIFTDDGAALI